MCTVRVANNLSCASRSRAWGLDAAAAPRGPFAKEIAQWRMEFDLVRAMRARGHEVTCVEPNGEVDPIRDAVEGGRPHVVFNMLEEFHGFVEFEPHVAALLEMLKVPFTGCNPRWLTPRATRRSRRRSFSATGSASLASPSTRAAAGSGPRVSPIRSS
jgi:hypothetical protein